LLLSNSDWDLIRHCEVPVWLVKKADDALARWASAWIRCTKADNPLRWIMS